MNALSLSRRRHNVPFSNQSFSQDEAPWEWWEPEEAPAEFDDPENPELPDLDDAHWDVFLADEDEFDPLPEDGDFWVDDRPEASARLG